MCLSLLCLSVSVVSVSLRLRYLCLSASSRSRSAVACLGIASNLLMELETSLLRYQGKIYATYRLGGSYVYTFHVCSAVLPSSSNE